MQVTYDLRICLTSLYNIKRSSWEQMQQVDVKWQWMRRKRKASEKPTYVHWGKGCASSKSLFFSTTFWTGGTNRSQTVGLWGHTTWTIYHMELCDPRKPAWYWAFQLPCSAGLSPSCVACSLSPSPPWPLRCHGQVVKRGDTLAISCSFVHSGRMRARAASLHNPQKHYCCWMTS